MSPDNISRKAAVPTLKDRRLQSDMINASVSLEAVGENLFKLLAHRSQSGFYIIQDGQFQFVNSRFQDYTGCTEKEILQRSPASFILPGDRRKTAKNALMMLKEQRFSPYEFRIVGENGQIKWIMETVMPIIFKGKRAILGNSTDITERKEANRRLEELEALESSILDAIPQAVVGLHERRINFANNAVKVIFGWHRRELIGQGISLIYRNEKESDKIASAFYSSLEHQRTYETEFPCLRKDGQEILCRMKASRIGEKLREKRIVVTYEDITAEKKALEELERSREELRNLSIHLQTVREEERTRVARKIHDELGQSLTALQMDMSWLKSRLPPGNESIRKIAQNMSGLVDSTIESVHNISTELRPSLLDDLGLPAAIEWQTADFQRRSGIRFRARISGSHQTIDQDLATTIFRIFQETLTNIARHSQATQGKVSFTQTATELCLEVTDNGVGVTRQQLDNPRSFGIIGMRERAHLWNGIVYVQNTQPSGTKVRVVIPFKQRKKQA